MLHASPPEGAERCIVNIFVRRYASVASLNAAQDLTRQKIKPALTGAPANFCALSQPITTFYGCAPAACTAAYALRIPAPIARFAAGATCGTVAEERNRLVTCAVVSNALPCARR